MSKTKEAPPKRRAQADRRQESYQRMLRAAVELIAEQGFTLTSLDEIGLRAGYSRGLVSHRFGSKEGLARTLIEEIARHVYIHTVTTAMEKEPGLEAVLSLADRYIRGLESDPPYTRALYVLMFESLGPLPGVRPAFAELSEGFIKAFEDLLTAAQAEGEIAREIDCKTTAVNIVANLRGITLMWLTAGESFNLEEARGELLATLRKRLVS